MFKRWLSIKPDRNCLIIGPRRSGKTTFLKQAFSDYAYVTLDDLDNLEWAKRDAKGFILSLGERAAIDEIQRLPSLTVAVKYAIDNANARFIMTGSSSLGLLDSSADTLAGRIRILSLPTACWGEALSQPDHSVFGDRLDPSALRKAQRTLDAAVGFGQFPEVLMQDSESDKRDVLNLYKNSYFTRDLMQMSNIGNLEGLLAVFHNLARSIGSHLEVSSFSRESGLSHPTSKKYLDTLFQSQLTLRLYGYQFGPAKRYIKASKTYFADNGIIEAMGIGLSQGQLLENFVIAELEKRRKLGFIKSDQFFYYKSAGGREIDLIFEEEGVLNAVEVKASRIPGAGDIRNLKEFSKGMDRPVECFLFHTGMEYDTVDGVDLIPVSALFRGK